MSLSGLFFKAAAESAQEFDEATEPMVCELFENRS
jgi:hypothetical protein